VSLKLYLQLAHRVKQRYLSNILLLSDKNHEKKYFLILKKVFLNHINHDIVVQLLEQEG